MSTQPCGLPIIHACVFFLHILSTSVCVLLYHKKLIFFHVTTIIRQKKKFASPLFRQMADNGDHITTATNENKPEKRNEKCRSF